MSQRKLLCAASLTAILGIALAGCSLFDNTPEPTRPTAPSASEGVDPESAQGQQAAFQEALESAHSDDDPVNRDRYITALVDAGFDPEFLEATSELDALGGRVAQIEFGLRIGDACIVGQSGEFGTNTTVTSPLQTGKCLIGDTPPID